jgi:N-acyl-D-amino-acid deacylase
MMRAMSAHGPSTAHQSRGSRRAHPPQLPAVGWSPARPTSDWSPRPGAAPWLSALLMIVCASCAPGPPPSGAPDFDVILRGGTLYDGRGGPGYRADVALAGDRIAAIGELGKARAGLELDVTGLAVAPGFINMLSWADDDLLVDGRSLSDIVQGVTLVVFGEGWSMGPLNEEMKERMREGHGSLPFEVAWTTLGEYLQHLEDRGVSTNVASFVGHGTVRIHVLGYEDRHATPEEMERMRALVREAMEEGAMGLGASLPYAPAVFAPTEELVELARGAAEHGGMYIAHIRDEGAGIFAALDEHLHILTESGARGEVHHLKVSGKGNWDKLDEVIRRLEAARAAGVAVTANAYPYHASSTGLNFDFPSWVKEGGHAAFIERLKDPETRARVVAGTRMLPPEDILLVSFKNPELRHLTGRTLAEVAAERGASAVETAIDLFIEDDSRVGTVRFTMSEDNVRKKLALPWLSFCSDSGSMAPEPPFTDAQPHPRAYGSFARILGKYVRDEEVLTLEEAIRRLTSFPAENLGLEHRGLLEPGYFADLVVFDPATISDHATFEAPHQLATGVHHVFVNGEPVVWGGEHTGAMPGRFVKGPGWKGP